MSMWPIVPLREVLRPVSDSHPVQADRDYPNFGIYSFGRGLFPKHPISGTATSAKTLYQVRRDQFIYSRLFAFEGAYGVVGQEFDGQFVSNEYPTFECDPLRLDLRYLMRYFQRPRTWEQVAVFSSGMGHRRQRVQPSQFLAYAITLPPLAEQRRLVERIDAVAAKIEEAKQLRTEADEGQDRLLVALAHRRDLTSAQRQAAGWQEDMLGRVLMLQQAPVPVATTESYPNLGIYSFGRGLFKKAPISGLETSAQTLYRVHGGQFIYSRLFAFEGAYGVVTDDYDGHFVSNEYPTFRCDPEKVRPGFLNAYFKAPWVWQQVAAGSKGLGDRRQRVHPDQVLAHRLYLPPMEWQDRIVAVHAHLDRARQDREAITVELTALVPAVLDRAFQGQL